MLIAIDGPAGAGKSTVARALARELGFTYLDSGAMYRCVALLALDAPGASPAELARAARIELDARATARVLLDGRDVSEAIRAPEVSEAASRVAADPGVREALVAKQRELIAAGDWVAEGRDIGTVVAPDAELKVFLTAEPAASARAGARPSSAPTRRRCSPSRRCATSATRTREHSPLRAAAGAVDARHDRPRRRGGRRAHRRAGARRRACRLSGRGRSYWPMHEGRRSSAIRTWASPR